MAQIMIDTDSEPIAGLMLLSRLLTDYANMRAVADKALADSYGPLQQHEHNPQLAAYAAGAQRLTGMVPELAASFGTPDTVMEPDPAKIFGKFPVPTGTNVVPLFPPSGVLGVTPGAPTMAPFVPPAPTIAPANALPVTTIAAGGATLPSATTATATTVLTNAPSAPVNGATVLSADVDSVGLSWDERIHSSSKAKKGDGTWKIKRGLVEGVAQTVTAELMAAKMNATAPGVPVAPVAGATNSTVTLPPASPTGLVPIFVPTAPTVPVSAVPVFSGPAGLPGASPGLPVGISPVSAQGAPGGADPGNGAVPPAPVSPVTRFREMMAKISAGLGSKAITQDNVKTAHEAVGLAQLQQAVLHPDKIPLIEAALGLS